MFGGFRVFEADLIRVDDVVVERAQVADIMRLRRDLRPTQKTIDDTHLPGEAKQRTTDDVNARRDRVQLERRLKGRIAFAENQHADVVGSLREQRAMSSK